jgi:hypothetical protein
MGQKRGRAEGSFVRETGAQTVTFYRDIVQNLKGWYPPAPKLHSEPDLQAETETVEHVISSPWDSEISSPAPEAP